MKKVISILLTLSMLFALAMPAFAGSTEKVVTVYLTGYGGSLYDENGEKIYGLDFDIFGSIKEVLDKMVISLVKGELTGDYDDFCDEIYNIVAPAHAEVILDKNGEAVGEDGKPYYAVGYDPLTRLNHNTYNYYKYDYYLFEYDWRLSCEYNAELMGKYIDMVLDSTKADKVNLIGRCLGANIISAYLQNATDAQLAKVNKTVMYVPSTYGVDFLDGLFTGKIPLDDTAVDNYVKYCLSRNDLIGAGEAGDETFEMLSVLVSFLNEIRVLGITLDSVQATLDKVKDNVLARSLRASYATFPSFWNMLSPSQTEDAINFVFPTPELKAEYAGLIEKVRSYRDNVQFNAAETMKACAANGIDIMVISKYNFPNGPLSENQAAQSDSTASVTATSFGAVAADFGKVLDKSYIDSMSESDKKYLSPDTIIDASTCLFPEKTWFIKNLNHADFPASVDALMNAFLTTDNMTIDTYEEYPQFMKHDLETDTLSPVTGIDKGDIQETGADRRFPVFIRFFTMIINLITKLIKGELDLGSIFG